MQLIAAPHLPCVEIPGRGLQIDFTTVPCVATRDAWGRKVCGDVGQCGIIKLVVHDMLRDVWSSASQHAMHTKHFDIDIVSVRRKAVRGDNTQSKGSWTTSDLPASNVCQHNSRVNAGHVAAPDTRSRRPRGCDVVPQRVVNRGRAWAMSPELLLTPGDMRRPHARRKKVL